VKGRKTQEGGVELCFILNNRFLFSKTQNQNDQKLVGHLLKILFRSVCSGMKKQREKRRSRTQKIYTGSFHNSEVVLSPLHFQGEFTKCNI